MEDDREDGGLFNITLSSDSDTEQKSQEEEKKEKAPRDYQSEAHFQHQLKSWRPKVEVGNIHKTLTLPLHNPSKPASQTILHAIEELYFLKRYGEALVLVEKALEGELSEEFRGVLVRYGGRIEGKLRLAGGNGKRG